MDNNKYTAIKNLLNDAEVRLAHSTSYSSDNALFDSITYLIQVVEKLNDHIYDSEYYSDSKGE